METYKCKNCGKKFLCAPVPYLDLTTMETEVYCSRICAETITYKEKRNDEPEKKPRHTHPDTARVLSGESASNFVRNASPGPQPSQE